LVEDTPILKDNGTKNVRILRGSDDPNRLIVIMEWENMKKAKDLVKSEFMRERFQAGGVIGKPDIYFVEEH
jgi:heme-degrading monooxygenase HmoA